MSRTAASSSMRPRASNGVTMAVRTAPSWTDIRGIIPRYPAGAVDPAAGATPGSHGRRHSLASLALAPHQRASVRARLGARLAAGEGQAQDGALDHSELLAERAAVIGQAVAHAYLAHPGRDLAVTGARHVREQVVLDLIAEISADHVEERPAVDVGRAHELAHVPRPAGLLRRLLDGEG